MKKIFLITFICSFIFLVLLIFGGVVRNIHNPIFNSIKKPVIKILDFPISFYRTYVKKTETRYRLLPNSLINKDVGNKISKKFDYSIVNKKIAILEYRKKKSFVTIYYPDREKEVFSFNFSGIKFIHTDERWLYQYKDNNINKISFKNNKIEVIWSKYAPNLHHEWSFDKDFNISAPQFFNLESHKNLASPKTKFFSDVLLNAKAPPYKTGEIFAEDAIFSMDKDGKIKDNIGLTEIFYNSGLKSLIYNAGLQIDPYHLNSVVRIDQNFSNILPKKGDYILSLRHMSMIAIYRPNLKKIIWYKIGPWSNQHSAQINQKGELYLFNNNVIDTIYSKGRDNHYFLSKEKNIINKFNFITNEVEIEENCNRPKDIYAITGGRVILKKNILISIYRGITMFCNLDTKQQTFLFPDTNDGIVDTLAVRYLKSN